MIVYNRSTSLLGERIKALREQRQLTQRELAQRSGVGRAHLAALERGWRGRQPTVPTLAALAGALGVSVSDLVGC